MEFNLEGNFIDVVKGLIDVNLPLVSNLSNLSSLLMDRYDNTSWCGFYLVDESNSLYLGPFQGKIACTRIPFGKGVCGTALKEKKTQLVPNVHEFKGHIACSSSTNSEIVVPIIKGDTCVGVIDLDSVEFSNYTLSQQKELEEIATAISLLF